ncbi:hypothetical protein [Moorena producens]
MVFFYWTIKLSISFPSCLLPLASCLLAFGSIFTTDDTKAI